MEARAHPRTRLSVPVGLYCADKNRYYRRKISNISMCGLFVTGTRCGPERTQLEVIINPVGGAERPPDRFPAQIARTAISGFALSFDPLDDQKLRTLEHLIWPKWDGKQLFEGLLIVAPRTDIDDLAGWMRLTSLLCQQYRRLCRKNVDWHRT